MATYRDLAMPSAKEVRRDLRGLRVGVSGPASADAERRAVFVAALEQAEQFTEAAVNAGPATRPVQIFYALSQFGRAIAAASRSLGRDEWRLKGHGIKTQNIDASQGLAHVEVIPTVKGSLAGVARALGVEPLEPETRLRLGDLWRLIPEAQRVPLPGTSGLPVMNFSPGTLVHRGAKMWRQISVYPVPREVRLRSDSDRAALDEFLAKYPSLTGWSHTPDAPDTVLWRERGNGAEEELEIFLPSALTGPVRPEEERAEALRPATLYRGPGDAYAFPALGGMSGPVHPLLAWWAALFGLSILARYEPEAWAEIVDINGSPAANAVEHLLDEAIAVVPHMALLAILNVAGR
ncbi:YaaC family protein [Streptomyces sp. NPDC096198]|uniref:YaaC family protein n=1 Tax=Streptomyces sp. NPDC096198 TaxID=3366080 RepID=UPI003803DC89